MAGIGVNAHEPGQLSRDASLFLDLTHGGISDGLTGFHGTAW